MTPVVLDDHLLRDVLADDMGPDLARTLADHTPSTTNLYWVRLCRSVAGSRGGALTGSWPQAARRALGSRLMAAGDEIEIVPMRTLAFRVAELAGSYALSSLGAEAVAAAEHLGAPLCVWAGNDGPRIEAAIAAIGAEYRVLHA